MSIIQGTSKSSAAGYSIDQSIRFNDNDSAYLSRTPSSAGDRRTWTWSCWIKRSTLGTEQIPFFCGPSGSDLFFIEFKTGNTLSIGDYNGSYQLELVTDRVFRDPSAWYHLMLVFDTTQSTSSDRAKLYINGQQETSFSTETYPSLNYEGRINATTEHTIGYKWTNTSKYFDGYLAEINFIDGTALDPTDFGETDASTGQWTPVQYAGSYGSNGFYITGEDSTFLGQDVRTSGDQVNSFQSSQYTGATSDYTFSDGRVEADTSNRAIRTVDTFTGDFEFTWRYVNMANFIFGLYEIDEDGTFSSTSSAGNMQNMTDSWYVQTSSVAANRDIKYGSTTVVESTTISNGDVWKMTRESGTIKVYRNGSLVHTFTQTSTNEVRLVIAQGDSTADANQIAWVDNSTLGNNFFSSGLAAADQVSDSPTDNYATLNPLITPATMTFTDGNLALSGYTASTSAYGTFGMSSGKWYWELVAQSNAMAGVAATPNGSQYPGQAADSYSFDLTNGTKYNNGSSSTFGSGSVSAGDTVGVAFDADNGDLKFYDNSGTLIGTAYTGLTSGPYFPVFRNGSAANISINFGQQTFSHSLPTSHVALSTANLDDPTIADPSAYFQTTLYTGNNGTQAIVNSGNSDLAPDLVWIKSRTTTRDHILTDAVRGVTKSVSSNTTSAEVTDADTLTAFGSDGFTVGDATSYSPDVNASGVNYVAWQWKANGSGSSNTDGSITSTVSANTTSGFSIVSYTGTGSAATVGHGLGVAPSMIIARNRSTTGNWSGYHVYLGATKTINLNETAAAQTSSGNWNNTEPTSSVFSVNTATGTNGSGNSIVAYCFAEVEGFSKFGSFEGNGSSDGPFITLNFRPAIFMMKRYDSTGAWLMFDDKRDGFNVDNDNLRADQTVAEQTDDFIDIVSNGVKIRSSATTWLNASGGDYLYMAFAQSPFKTATAR